MNIAITDPGYQEKTKILDALYGVVDPELGINIVDLGLVYGININEAAKEISIDMTLSTPSCPLGSIITGHTEAAAIAAMPGFKAAVNLVWEPQWCAERISEAGKAALGW